MDQEENCGEKKRIKTHEHEEKKTRKAADLKRSAAFHKMKSPHDRRGVVLFPAGNRQEKKRPPPAENHYVTMLLLSGLTVVGTEASVTSGTVARGDSAGAGVGLAFITVILAEPVSVLPLVL